MRHSKNDRNGVGVKEDKCKGKRNIYIRAGVHPLVPNQYRRGGPSNKGLRGSGFAAGGGGGGGEGANFGVLVKISFGKNALLG